MLSDRYAVLSVIGIHGDVHLFYGDSTRRRPLAIFDDLEFRHEALLLPYVLI